MSLWNDINPVKVLSGGSKYSPGNKAFWKANNWLSPANFLSGGGADAINQGRKIIQSPGHEIKSAIGGPSRLVGRGIAGLAGRDSWLGKRALAGTEEYDFWKDVAGIKTGYEIGAKKVEKQQEEAGIVVARKAAHDAEVAQLAQDSMGAVSMRRRRGMYATMLTGTPMMGSSPGPSGKTMLSQ